MCLDRESEGSGLDRRDFLIEGAAAFAGLGAFGAEGAAQKKEQPPTRVLDDPDIQHGKVTLIVPCRATRSRCCHCSLGRVQR
jgi:hypothetical protein